MSKYIETICFVIEKDSNVVSDTLDNSNAYDMISKANNPYGDGKVCSNYVQLLNLMVINPNKKINIGGYGDMLANFYKLYSELARFAKLEGIILMSDKGPAWSATIYT